MMSLLFVSFFFFQAEDGIRDLIVTGVQTCALPILVLLRGVVPEAAVRAESIEARLRVAEALGWHLVRLRVRTRIALYREPAPARLAKIGRASCRERV